MTNKEIFLTELDLVKGGIKPHGVAVMVAAVVAAGPLTGTVLAIAWTVAAAAQKQ